MEASSFISNLCSRTIPPSRVPTDKSQAWKSTPLTKALQQSVGLGQICPSDRFQSQNGLLSLGPLHPPATFGDAPKVSRSSRANSFPVGKNQTAGVVFAFRASLSVCLSVCQSVCPCCRVVTSVCLSALSDHVFYYGDVAVVTEGSRSSSSSSNSPSAGS